MDSQQSSEVGYTSPLTNYYSCFPDQKNEAQYPSPLLGDKGPLALRQWTPNTEAALLGNLLIMGTIWREHSLHTPMYAFVSLRSCALRGLR